MERGLRATTVGKNNGRTEYTPYAYSSTYLASTAHFSHRSISSSSVAISSPSSSKLSSSSSCSHAVMRSEKFYTTHHNKMFKFILLNLFLYFFDAGKVKSKVHNKTLLFAYRRYNTRAATTTQTYNSRQASRNTNITNTIKGQTNSTEKGII